MLRTVPMRRELQLGRKTFEFIRDGVGKWRGSQSSLSLLGFEVCWLGSKLQKISQGQMGCGFMGSLRMRERSLECSLLQNREGKFVEVNLIVSNRREKICIPKSEGCDGWSTFASTLIDFESCWGQRTASQRKSSSMASEISTSTLYNDDRVMSFLGRIFLNQVGATKVPFEEIKIICEWIDQMCGMGTSTMGDLQVDLGADRKNASKPVGDFNSLSSNRGAEKMDVRGAVRMKKTARVDTLAKESGETIETSEPREPREKSGGLVSKKVIEARKSLAPSPRYGYTAGYNSKLQKQSPSGAFIRGLDLAQSGAFARPLFSIVNHRNKFHQVSKVVGHDNFVWVQKHKLFDGNGFKHQNGVLERGNFEEGNSKLSISSNDIRTDVECIVKQPSEEMKGSSFMGENFTSATLKSFGSIEIDENLILEKIKAEKMEAEVKKGATDGHDFKGQNGDLKKETVEECNSKLSMQENIIETDNEEGKRSPIRGVDRDKDSAKFSHEMQLKRLRAKRTLKGQFWFSNRLDFFRAQRRCGSIRMKNLIFGV